jgi:hypothetical protein
MLNCRKLSRARKAVLGFLFIAGLDTFGCQPLPQGPQGAGPEAVVRQYASHLIDGQTQEAHRLLSSRSRKEVSGKSFQRFIAEGSQRLKQLLKDLATAELEVELTAILKAEDGSQVVLVREGETWRLDSGTVVPSLGFSAQAAVKQFVRAIEAKDCQAVLACAPPKTLANHQRDKLLRGCRDKMEHLLQIAARIRSCGAQPQQVSPTRAELTYHQNKKLIVIKHESRWYIEDL